MRHQRRNTTTPQPSLETPALFRKMVKLAYYRHPGKWPRTEFQARSVSKMPIFKEFASFEARQFDLDSKSNDVGFLRSLFELVRIGPGSSMPEAAG